MPASLAVANVGSVADLSKWNVSSYKVDLLNHRGGSGDIQADQNGWIHLGANHLEGGDIKYDVRTGHLNRDDILEVWIDGYSTSNDLNIGPTVFIGTGKNRFEQITRMTGDAWRPFVFRFADDALYGDVTDPSNRNANWRIRYPSSKYEIRRIDKSPRDLLDGRTLPVRVSITGAEDFIIKRMEVVVYRAQHGGAYDGLYIVNLTPYKIHKGDMMTLQLNRALPSEQIDFYVIRPDGHEQKVTPVPLNSARDKVGIYTDTSLLPKSGRYQVKLVDRTQSEQALSDVEYFEYVAPKRRKVTPRPKKTPKPEPVSPCPSTIPGACAPSTLPPVPTTPSAAYGMPVTPGSPVIQPVVPMPGAQVVVPPTFLPGVAPSTDDPTAYTRGYTIQIGAYNTQASAVSMQKKLQQYGYNVSIVEAVQKGKRLYRVRVGPYPTRALAQEDASRLRRNGFDTWVTSSS
jgi:cell division protein FtsN